MVNLSKKGVIFGLDARIVLAILAFVSLGMAFSKETQITSEQKDNTKVQLKLLKEKFLDKWEQIRFEGYGTDDATLTVENVIVAPYNAPNDRVRMFSSGTEGLSSQMESDFINPDNGKSYKNYRYYYVSDYLSQFNAKSVKMYQNFESGSFDVSINSYYRKLIKDMHLRILKSFKLIGKQDGFAQFSATTESDISNGSANVITFREDGFSRDIRMYFIAEHNVSNFAPSEYILNVVLYSLGKNGQLDSTLPINIAELRTFTSSGDDVFEIFSTKDIYTKAKIENLKRIRQIAEKIKIKAESDYLSRMSLCDTEEIPTASCDVNTDGVYDYKDTNIIKNYNMYLKSSQDSTSTTYLDKL